MHFVLCFRKTLFLYIIIFPFFFFFFNTSIISGHRIKRTKQPEVPTNSPCGGRVMLGHKRHRSTLQSTYEAYQARQRQFCWIPSNGFGLQNVERRPSHTSHQYKHRPCYPVFLCAVVIIFFMASVT